MLFGIKSYISIIIRMKESTFDALFGSVIVFIIAVLLGVVVVIVNSTIQAYKTAGKVASNGSTALSFTNKCRFVIKSSTYFKDAHETGISRIDEIQDTEGENDFICIIGYNRGGIALQPIGRPNK